MKHVLDMTTAELEKEYADIQLRIEADERAPFRSWQMNRDYRNRLYSDAIKIEIELSQRGIQKKGSPDPDYDLLTDIRDTEDRIETGDRVHGHRLILRRLLELLAYRRLVRRQELTRDDIDREYATYLTDRHDNGLAPHEDRADVFEVGLRRGFAMRAEEREKS